MTAEPEPSRAAETQEQSSRDPRLGFIIALAIFAVVVIVLIYGYLAKPGWIGSSGKQFWDYLDLLIVPAALALGVFWLNRRQTERDQQAEEARQERAQQAEEAQQERALAVESQRAQDEALQAYLDQMAQLLTDKEQPLHEAQPGDSLRTVARARTLTVLGRLDSSRKGSVLQFLYESELIYPEHTFLNESDLFERRLHIVSLQQADLRAANLSRAYLSGTDLSRANLSGADLSRASLFGTDLSGANLSRANLSRADLFGADLSKTDLSWADLSEAELSPDADLTVANLSGANLSGASLSEVYLSGAWLTGADLSGADLSEADLLWAKLRGADLSEADLRDANLSLADLEGALGLTNQQLAETRSLEGAIMPDGQRLKSTINPEGPTFEDWLEEHE